MKKPKERSDDEFLSTVQDRSKRKERFGNKKSRTRDMKLRQYDEERADKRKKVKNLPGHDRDPDDWDDDDQILFQWRRRGHIEQVTQSEDESIEKE